MPSPSEEASAGLELLDDLERKFLDMEAGLERGPADREAVHSLFRCAHSLKGSVALCADEGATKLVHCIEGSLDQMRSGRLQPTHELIDAILAASDRIRETLEGGQGAADCGALVEAIERARGGASTAPRRGLAEEAGFELSALEEADIRAQAARGSHIYIAEKLLDGSLEPDRVAGLPVLDAIRGCGRLLAVRPEGFLAPLGEESLLRLLFASDLAPEELLFVVFDPVRELRVDIEAEAKESVEFRKAERSDVRVDTAKLDKLFDLVGELITAESMLGSCPDLAGMKLPRFTKAFRELEKITRELQETTMAVRMVPLEGLFDRMARLVRDLSRKVGKEVELVVSGEDREMDKKAIEKIADPLVHLIRNAVDHGIETPERRRAAGKAARGRVGLRARYEGSDILIEVSDDGSGFDDEAVLRAAVERGLVTPGASLSRAEVRELVFMPGFSTSTEVSDISGRGVGLDVVKRNLEKLRGGVEVLWEKGAGTTFVLKIPLTLAIIDAMTVRAGLKSYAIPVCDIREFFKPKASQLVRAGGERLELRGEFLPLIRLDEALEDSALPGPREGGSNEGIALVAQAGGRRACLLIDEIVGAQQVVVKPLPEYLGEVDGLSGCSVNGDGGVSFIVDTARVLARGGR